MIQRLDPNVVSDGFYVLWSIEQVRKLMSLALLRYSASEGREELAKVFPAHGPADTAAFADQEAERLRIFACHSMLVTAFGAFENSFVALSREVLRVVGNGKAENDFEGGHLKRAKSILQQLLSVERVFKSEDWKLVEGATRLRNIVMHSGGMINGGGRTEKDAIQITGLGSARIQDLSKRRIVLIGDKFVAEAISAFQRVLLSAADEARANHVAA